MEMCFGSKGINNYLDVNIGSISYLTEQGYMYQVEMLSENQIVNLLKPTAVELDGNITLRYETGCMYVLDRLFQKIKPDGVLLRLLVDKIYECGGELEKYLLSMDDLVLNPDYMFFDYEHKSLKLVCVPGYGNNLMVQMKHFLEYIMQIFDHRDREGLMDMYSMYDRVSGGNIPVIMDSDRVKEDEDRYITQNKEGIKADNDIYRLIPLTSGALKDIILENDISSVVIGRGRKETDYRIRTTQISRIHACIYRQEDGIYVEDRESTNGTFLNAVRIPPLEKKKLNKGDIVGFANEEFFVLE